MVFAVTYMEIVGIMIGQVLVGILGDGLGRRFGLIQDAVIMFLGLIMLTASWGGNLNGWVICYAISLLFYGVGVGGEYPMTATAAMENATGSGRVSTKEDRLHRGRKTVTVLPDARMGSILQSSYLDCPSPDLPPQLKATVFSRRGSMDFPNFLRYPSSRYSLARLLPLVQDAACI